MPSRFLKKVWLRKGNRLIGIKYFLIKGKKYLVDEKRICTFATPKRSAERKRGRKLEGIFEGLTTLKEESERCKAH